MMMQLDCLPHVTTHSEFITWMSRAKPNDICVYHQGELGAEAQYDNELSMLADTTLMLWKKDKVRLFQKRVGKTPEPERVGRMAYLCQKVRA